MPNLYVFTGENEYMMRREKERWLKEFAKKYGSDNIVRVDGAERTIRELLDDVSVMPFLAEKRLVMVHGIPRCTEEEVQAIVKNQHPDVLLLFVDKKPDKRGSGVKELLSQADVKEFTLLKGKPFLDWALSYAREEKASIDPEALRLLIEYDGEDQGLLSEDIKKLSLHAQGSTITAKEVELLAVPSDEGIIWKISDYLCAGSPHDAIAYARRMLDRGGDAQGLWAVFLSFVRNLVLVRAALESGIHGAKGISEATGVHIFAVRSLAAYAKKIKPERLEAFVRWVVDADIALKTGSYRTSDDAPEEMLVVIDSFILKAP